MLQQSWFSRDAKPIKRHVWWGCMTGWNWVETEC
jgi:hypothetical protein